jgi:hypothetical protein
MIVDIPLTEQGFRDYLTKSKSDVDELMLEIEWVHAGYVDKLKNRIAALEQVKRQWWEIREELVY